MKKGLILFCLFLSSCSTYDYNSFKVQNMGLIYPDYMDVTVPSEIAPLNFSYTRVCADDVITSFSAGQLNFSFKGRHIRWKNSDWVKICEAAKGTYIEVKSAPLDTLWRIYVSEDSIDYGISYRLLEPGYEVYSKMGIFERRLSSFKEIPIFENTEFNGCVNCHSFNEASPEDLSLHIRGPHGATLIRKDGQMAAYQTSTPHTLGSCVYPYWHPGGEYIAYSTNSTRQGFHVSKEKLIEVFDSASDILIYNIKTNSLHSCNSLSGDGYWETFPAFSPDGKTLYFCRAIPQDIPDGLKEVRYDLCSIAFNPETGKPEGELKILIEASKDLKSISFPRPSRDGKYLVYTLSDYGNFSIWHHEADLFCLDLLSGISYPLSGANSPDTESYHSFSSNGRWMVFSSRRDDGLYTRPYICHFDSRGQASKAFMLPQKDPMKYYSTLFFSYNIPEFITGPLNFDRQQAQRLIKSKERVQMEYSSF